MAQTQTKTPPATNEDEAILEALAAAEVGRLTSRDRSRPAPRRRSTQTQPPASSASNTGDEKSDRRQNDAQATSTKASAPARPKAQPKPQPEAQPTRADKQVSEQDLNIARRVQELMAQMADAPAKPSRPRAIQPAPGQKSGRKAVTPARRHPDEQVNDALPDAILQAMQRRPLDAFADETPTPALPKASDRTQAQQNDSTRADAENPQAAATLTPADQAQASEPAPGTLAEQILRQQMAAEAVMDLINSIQTDQDEELADDQADDAGEAARKDPADELADEDIDDQPTRAREELAGALARKTPAEGLDVPPAPAGKSRDLAVQIGIVIMSLSSAALLGMLAMMLVG